ncbi:hypothetical protein ANANG_G00286080, partial [Anguilla anguilla]
HLATAEHARHLSNTRRRRTIAARKRERGNRKKKTPVVSSLPFLGQFYRTYLKDGCCGGADGVRGPGHAGPGGWDHMLCRAQMEGVVLHRTEHRHCTGKRSVRIRARTQGHMGHTARLPLALCFLTTWAEYEFNYKFSSRYHKMREKFHKIKKFMNSALNLSPL